MKPIAEILTTAFVVGEARVNSPFSSVRVLASNVESGILNAAMLANSTGCKSALLTTFPEKFAAKAETTEHKQAMINKKEDCIGRIVEYLFYH